jgi:branched-chain amino acid transport system substrate-binding protein
MPQLPTGKRATAALAAIVLTAAIASGVARPARVAASSPAACGGTIGLIAPLTGQAAVVGQEIKNWSQLALTSWNKQHKAQFTLFVGDDQLSPAQDGTIAQQFASNQSIVALIGPAASQSVVAAGPILNRVHLAMVSPSATQTNLTTSGTLPDFFRVVARDDAQGPTAAKYIASTLHAKHVMVVDDESSFSVGLADSADTVLKQNGVTVDRESVSQQATDYSSLVAKASSADLVFLTWQLPANIKLFVQQLQAQGKKTPTFATTFDGGTNYVSSFSINAHTYKPDAALVHQYEALYGQNYTGQFGPPSYVAAQVVMTAITSLCKAHKPISRVSVLGAIRKVKLPKSILGRPIAFDKHGDLVNGRFYIYRLAGKNYQLVS